MRLNVRLPLKASASARHLTKIKTANARHLTKIRTNNLGSRQRDRSAGISMREEMGTETSNIAQKVGCICARVAATHIPSTYTTHQKAKTKVGAKERARTNPRTNEGGKETKL
jgi:hypothetical protein